MSYFKPFGASTVNHTSEVAALTKKKMEAVDPSLEVVLCPLHDEKSKDGIDVTFYSPRKDLHLGTVVGPLKGKSSFEALKTCYEQHSDAAQVISLGEGGCEVDVEGVGKNVMSTGYSDFLKDHGGNLIPVEEKIMSSSSDTVKTDDINVLATCLEHNKKNLNTGYSTDAGNYVCNNLLFNFQSYVNFNKLPLSYSFIHIPRHLDRADFCGDLKEFKSSPNEVLTNESFTEKIGQLVSSFILEKEEIMKSLARSPDKKQTLEKLCTDGYSEQEDNLVDYSEKAFAKLQKLEKDKVLADPIVQACIKRIKHHQNKAKIVPESSSTY